MRGRATPLGFRGMATGVRFGMTAAVLLTAATAVANASVISFAPAIDFASAPAQIDIGTGGFVFAADTVAGDPPALVSTTGSGKVSSIFGGVADFGAGANIDQTAELYGFSSFAAPTAIPYSAADDFIGLSFVLANGLHFGYAEVAGTELVGYGYETAADTSIATGAVPEPATIALLASGTAGLACLRRRRKAIGAVPGAVAEG